MKPLDTLSQCLDALEWEATCKDELDIDLARLKEIHAKLRELTRWIPVTERKATLEDADAEHKIMWYDAKNHVCGVGYWYEDTYDISNWSVEFITHWRRIDTPIFLLYRLTKDTP